MIELGKAPSNTACLQPAMVFNPLPSKTVGLRAMINGEKQKNEKEEHGDLTWFG